MTDKILEWLMGAYRTYVKAYSMVTDEVMVQLGTIRIETIEALVEYRKKQLKEAEDDNP